MRRTAESERPWFYGQLAAIVAGFAAIAIYSWRQHEGMRLTIFACCSLLALASHLVGAVTGFIFGIPKTVTGSSDGTTTTTTSYQGNTNLEQISDWLTKILVGAGLVELGKIGVAFDSMTGKLDKNGSLGNSGNVVAPTIMILFAIAGFLLAYLYARIYLAREFRAADTDERPDTILGKMAALLYKPGGYNEVIQIGDELLKLGSPSDARFWVYYACAYGQKYKTDKANNVADEMSVDRQKALDAVKEALAMEPAMKSLLHNFWRPGPGATDDDLAVFADDDDFAAILS